MIQAVKYIKPMAHGETKAQLFECSDGKKYVIKFMSNPTGVKPLVHEYIANELAKYLNLPIAKGEIIYFSEDLIKKTPEIAELNVQKGPHFGCLYIENAVRPSSKDRIVKCRNLTKFPGVIVFDHWLQNRDRSVNLYNLIIDEGKKYNDMYMIDHAGAFFNYRRTAQLLRESATYMDVYWGELYESFRPYINDKKIFYRYIKQIEYFPEEMIKKIVHTSPREWEPYPEELDAIAEFLIVRKKLVKHPIHFILKNYIIP